MPSRGTIYRKRPCACGRPTRVRLQIRLREIGVDRKAEFGLASRTVSLCTKCGNDLYDSFEEALERHTS